LKKKSIANNFNEERSMGREVVYSEKPIVGFGAVIPETEKYLSS
jgi:hypothetical protein